LMCTFGGCVVLLAADRVKRESGSRSGSRRVAQQQRGELHTHKKKHTLNEADRGADRWTDRGIR
jgi:hypothetical protein